MSDCIFCKIVAGEIPSSKVYEDEKVLAFLDITQVTKGHTLLIPKEHVPTMADLSEQTASDLFARAPKIARHLMKTLGASGMNLINNTNEVAGQTVFHTHLHLLPRYDEMDDLKITFTAHEPDFAALAALSQDLYLGE